ncbi:hypothetical protein CEXT_704191 [Caerostris extrusa]|uniref:Uncharacterized protein n=1 Tax=Caerostris extrusa TaxID=172846 RepID=A0AAV4XH00_CAEEX|nr:hypothetical protein CEXT_704191 [Caerostris extrusa]
MIFLKRFLGFDHSIAYLSQIVLDMNLDGIIVTSDFFEKNTTRSICSILNYSKCPTSDFNGSFYNIKLLNSVNNSGKGVGDRGKGVSDTTYKEGKVEGFGGIRSSLDEMLSFCCICSLCCKCSLHTFTWG